MIDFPGSCEKYLPLIEFAYNNSFQSTIGMALCMKPYMQKVSFACPLGRDWKKAIFGTRYSRSDDGGHQSDQAADEDHSE